MAPVAEDRADFAPSAFIHVVTNAQTVFRDAEGNVLTATAEARVGP